jgi:UDP-3-O-[3-hydroxymyristoyl] N-acetylglucosamine deacetylase
MQYRKLTGLIERKGAGLHSGRDFCLSIEPSDEALSLEAGGTRMPVSKLALEGTGRGSDLIFPDGKRVRTCEHVLSALAGLGVWRGKLSVTGDFPMEMPGLDGCSLNLAAEIMEKSVPCEGEEPPFALRYPVHAGDNSRFVAALPSSSFHITCVIDYDAAPIGTRIFDYGGGDYIGEIAPARTFVMRSDVEKLRAAGLALGGSLGNAILVDGSGVETTGGLRFQDEFARHKVLDLLGDLACLGRPLIAHVVAVRAGHVQHLQLVERLRAASRLD